jgi:DNA-binding NarL/FixJ family response regulator
MVRLMVVDGARLFAEGLARAIADDERVEVVSTATTVDQLTARVAVFRPGIVLIGGHLPDTAPMVTAARKASPTAKVVVIGSTGDEAAMLRAVDAGCDGWVGTDVGVARLVEAVLEVADGQASLPPAVIRSLLPRLRGEEPGPGHDLTERERDVLRLLAEGCVNRLIADRLGLRLNTVRNHVQRVLGKLGAHSRLEAVAIARRQGLVAAA